MESLTFFEGVSEKTCRLCWGDEDDGPLVQPCACRGSGKFIHKACLEKWRRTSPKQDAAYRCGQCMDRYRDALSLELLSARLQAEQAEVADTGERVLMPSAEGLALSASRYSSMHWPQR